MANHDPFGALPVIDVAPLLAPEPAAPAEPAEPAAPAEPARLTEVARQIEAACPEHGFFYVTGHGLAPELLDRLAAACTAFFGLPLEAKMEIAMARGGHSLSAGRWPGHAGAAGSGRIRDKSHL